MRNRTDILELFKQYEVGAEIGVLGGMFSAQICEANPNIKLYCVDKWGLDERRYRDYHLRKYEEAKERLLSYNCVLIRKSSMDAVRDFENGFLDFVYIDAKHEFDYVMQDIIEWTRKVRAGGVVAGDDYIDGSASTGVKDAVDMYVKYHNLELNLVRDSNWYFIKP